MMRHFYLCCRRDMHSDPVHGGLSHLSSGRMLGSVLTLPAQHLFQRGNGRRRAGPGHGDGGRLRCQLHRLGHRPAGQQAAHQEAGEGIARRRGVHRLHPEGRLGVLLRSDRRTGNPFRPASARSRRPGTASRRRVQLLFRLLPVFARPAAGKPPPDSGRSNPPFPAGSCGNRVHPWAKGSARSSCPRSWAFSMI